MSTMNASYICPLIFAHTTKFTKIVYPKVSHSWAPLSWLASINNMYHFQNRNWSIKECERISTNPSLLQEKQLNPHTLMLMGQQNAFQLEGAALYSWKYNSILWNKHFYFAVESLNEIGLWSHEVGCSQGDTKVTLGQKHGIQWMNRRHIESNFPMGKELADFMDHRHRVKEVSLNHRLLDKDLMVTRHLKL